MNYETRRKRDHARLHMSLHQPVYNQLLESPHEVILVK